MPEPKTAARKISLTDRSLQAMKPLPAGKRLVTWDALMPGMAVRVSGKGKNYVRSFYAVKRRAGQPNPSWVMLGRYPVMSLAEARAKARETLGALIAGEDLAAVALAKRRAAEEAEQARQATTLAAVAEQYIKRHVAKLRSGAEAIGILHRELIPAWGERQLAEISKKDVIKLVEGVVDRGGAKPEAGHRRSRGGDHAARKRLAVLRGLFSWAVGRDLIPTSPCGGISSKNVLGTAAPRDRVLDDDELRAVWRAAGAEGFPFGSLVRLLLLTGQRRDEIGEASWPEIDLDKGLLTIGSERMKTKTAHVVPLTPAAVEILRDLPRFAGGDCVISQSGAKPFSGFTRAKARLDARIAAESGAIKAFTLHDLRRTVRTRLSELGVLPFVAELILAHTQQGVAKVYDLHRYDTEKREALEAWERRLMSIVAPEPAPAGEVVQMRRRARG
jgi:integrase